MYHKLCVIFLIGSVFWTSCIEHQDSKIYALDSVLATFRRDTFYTEIPKTRLGSIGPEYETVRRSEKYLNLGNIDNGVDSIEIRIWYGYQIDTAQMVRITNNHHKWSGSLFTYSFTEKNDVIKSVVYKQPLIGWNIFISELVHMGLFTLPDADEIEDYVFATDASRILVEIAGKNMYRLYTYDEPRLQKSTVVQAKQIEKILAFIEKQFQFKMLEKI
jgi:hypothetical protein